MQQTETPAAAGLDPRAKLRLARHVAMSLPVGVIGFWVVAWVTTGGGRAPQSPELMTVESATRVWTVVALLTIAGGLMFRGRAAAVAHEAARSGEPGSAATQAQAWLLVAAVLMETLALATGVFLLMLGTTHLLWYTVPLYAAGVAATFPRAEWFGVDPRSVE